ncbi:DUF2158 domain-containing protein [Pseudomonas sp. RP23018S]|uniref:DUF2158 domain-containing protein n=1 Tax=Pseudomonas sp. RP23018S TaxID=3096037 RepID=UPI003A0FE2C9
MVELVSGGPVMTVIRIENHSYRVDGRSRVTCEWYEGGRYQTRAFVPSALRKTNRRPQRPFGC